MRVVFFGSPAFAVPSLSALLEAGFDVPLVVSQPDRPVGRSSAPRPTAVAALAEASRIPVARPERIRDDADFLARLSATAPDAIAVVAYGRILPPAILRLPRLGGVNVHASLLPKYRGASPIQAALLNGDAQTGVVTMRIVDQLDAGPLFLEREVAIAPGETAGELSERLAALGGSLLVETLRGLEAGTLAARPQEGEATFCKTIRREDGEVDWTLPAPVLARRLRAFTPWPGLYTFAGSERVKILEAAASDLAASGEPGTARLESGRLLVAAGGGSALELRRVQRAGKGPVTGAELARSLGAWRFGKTSP
ncbi:MAG TPA: methionyl-tRNA formyltransferase [Thermoanaerobaculia bacterium]